MTLNEEKIIFKESDGLMQVYLGDEENFLEDLNYAFGRKNSYIKISNTFIVHVVYDQSIYDVKLYRDNVISISPNPPEELYQIVRAALKSNSTS